MTGSCRVAITVALKTTTSKRENTVGKPVPGGAMPSVLQTNAYTIHEWVDHLRCQADDLIVRAQCLLKASATLERTDGLAVMPDDFPSPVAMNDLGEQMYLINRQLNEVKNLMQALESRLATL